MCSGWVLSSAISFWKCPCEHSQRYVSWVILNPVMLMRKIRHRRGQLPSCLMQLSRNYTGAGVWTWNTWPLLAWDTVTGSARRSVDKGETPWGFQQSINACSVQHSATAQGLTLALSLAGIPIPKSLPQSDLYSHIISQRALILSYEAAIPISFTSLHSEITFLKKFICILIPHLFPKCLAQTKFVATRGLPVLFTVGVLPPWTIPGSQWTINNQ